MEIIPHLKALTYKNHDFNVEDKERERAPKRFEDKNVESILDEYPCQTRMKLAKALNITQQCISQ